MYEPFDIEIDEVPFKIGDNVEVAPYDEIVKMNEKYSFSMMSRDAYEKYYEGKKLIVRRIEKLNIAPNVGAIGLYVVFDENSTETSLFYYPFEINKIKTFIVELL